MDILIIYSTLSLEDRKTVTDSLYSFPRYLPEHRFYYLDLQEPKALPKWFLQFPFHGVIFHYTFASLRNNLQVWQPLFAALRPSLRALQGFKVLIAQDDNMNTGGLQDLIREAGVSHVFTGARPRDFGTIFPAEATGGAACSTVHPGYIDEDSFALIEKLRAEISERDIDIGYRGRHVPAWMGRHAQLKIEIAEHFQQALVNFPDLKTDIATTGGNHQNVFFGDDWFRFLLRCRVMPGTLGGASILDMDGSLVKRVNAYVKANPNADFNEIEAACFAGQDNQVELYALGPRHFECAMTKTCQVLLEGDYFGVFEPGVHYIELKKDYSNILEVLEQIRDKDYCEQIAQRCYDDVVAVRGKQNPNTYAWYANFIVGIIQAGTLAHSGLSGAQQRRCGHFCARRHRQVLWNLRYQRWLAIVYPALCCWLAARPAIKKLAEAIFRREFVERSSG